MPRSENAQLAVDLYNELQSRYQWTAETAWRGIALLLLSCEVYKIGWEPFHDVITYVDSNRFKQGKKGPHATLRRAEHLTDYMAAQLGVSRADVCRTIGLYWRHPKIRPLQPHNPAGHAFRSLVANILQRLGDPGVAYEEEVSPHTEFPGFAFPTRSKHAKIDIVARRDNRVVALLTVRWRFRHDRLDVLDEALAYAPAIHRQNPTGKVYAVLGEFDGGRLRKLLANCPPLNPNAAIASAVHFAPQLIREGLQENGTLEHLRSLQWLVDQSFRWK